MQPATLGAAAGQWKVVPAINSTCCCGNLHSLPLLQWLRQKGLSGADKKAGRVAAEGAIVRYIHPGSRLGVLLEVNCETDFVAAGEAFTSLANELAMVVASSEVVCVSVDDMPADLLAKEREVEMGKEDLKSKPEAVRAKVGGAEQTAHGWR
jgi:elongation factor Ts